MKRRAEREPPLSVRRLISTVQHTATPRPVNGCFEKTFDAYEKTIGLNTVHPIALKSAVSREYCESS